MIKLWQSRTWGILLCPLSFLYGSGLILRKWMYNCGFLPSNRLNAKVISVGNLTVGGTGKTPLVEYLARLLKKEGYRVAVLSRGFGRKSKGLVNVSDEEEIKVSAEEAGDEPFLLANRLHEIPIVVGKDRNQTGKYAINAWKTDTLILDDAFQYRKLKKDLDIVILDSTNPFGNNKLLPAGPLREPLSSIKKANIIVFTRANEGKSYNQKKEYIQQLTNTKIFKALHQPVEYVSLNEAKRFGLSELRGKNVIGFAGIGNPASFRKTLESLGVNLTDYIIFSDHHWYKSRDLNRIVQTAERKKVQAIITTEKDKVRLPSDWNPQIQVYYLRIDLKIEEKSDAFKKALNSVLQPTKNRGM